VLPPVCRIRPGRNITALDVQLVAPGNWPAIVNEPRPPVVT
jgi:hypothetical protein